MRKSSTSTSDYRPGSSRNAGSLDSFAHQMAYFAQGDRLRKLRSRHPEHPSREHVANEIGVSTKSLYEWEKRDGGIKWPNAQALAGYYGVEPEAITVREDEADNGEVTLQVFDGARADQLDRIEKKLDELLREIRARPAEDADPADDVPDDFQLDQEPPPDAQDEDEHETG